jgi:methylated-DNA-[protein]-cysteine S-methyltransferase
MNLAAEDLFAPGAEPDAAWLCMDSPVGKLTLSASPRAITSLQWSDAAKGPSSPLLDEAAAQLRAFFDGRLHEFDLPLAPAGTGFQRRVYAAMWRIPHGETRTYGEIADELGSAARAVGGACGSNPIPIIIPCHRVRASGGGIGGFSGGKGVATKTWLLDHEQGRRSLFPVPPLPAS